MTYQFADRRPEDYSRMIATLDLPVSPAPPVVDALLEVMEARWHDAPADRRLHDALAWELVSAIPLPPGAHVVEADRGGARWTRRWIDRGCRVTSLAGHEVTDCDADRIDWADEERGDLVLATATLQSAPDPFLALQRLVGLVKPGGLLCVRVENLLSLVLGWLQEEQRGHPAERSQPDRRRPKRRLYDSGTLKAALLDAGLVDVRCHALAVTATASGRLAACAPLADEDGLYAAIDRAAAHDPLLADAGLHILALARRP